jgi:hypothetical protein
MNWFLSIISKIIFYLLDQIQPKKLVGNGRQKLRRRYFKSLYSFLINGRENWQISQTWSTASVCGPTSASTNFLLAQITSQRVQLVIYRANLGKKWFPIAILKVENRFLLATYGI